jgi:tRNA (cmo5U34)-methyltransferase
VEAIRRRRADNALLGTAHSAPPEGACVRTEDMKTPLDRKSTTEEIRERFDHDVERFSNLETGQTATVDAPLAMELITQAAIAATPSIQRTMDIGCGAGNNTIRLRREYGRDFDCDLCDLSEPMLQKARERLVSETKGTIRVFHGDIRNLPLPEGGYDVILAAAVLHHLRGDEDWETTFRKMFSLLRPGGSLWITDMVTHESDAVHDLMWSRYAKYLAEQGGEAYRHKVFAYIDKEDSPRPVTFQLELMRRVGFEEVDILHKHSCFAAFGGKKCEQAPGTRGGRAPARAVVGRTG